MVSFQCESCGDVLTKKKLDPHRSRCRGATFSCIDCMVHFAGTEYRAHTSCMTEDQKYQGALYKNKNKKAKLDPPTAEASSSSQNTTKMAAAVQPHHMSHATYMEDASEDVNDFLVADDSDASDDDTPPHAPTPPPAAEGPVNVFDFLIASTSTTPNASNVHLTHGPNDPIKITGSAQVTTPFGRRPNELAGPAGFGAAAGPAAAIRVPFQTPAPADRAERHKKDTSINPSNKEVKKDKKRKRLYLDIHDQVMADAPPMLHSGLTGGLNRLSTKPKADFPPSPDSAETPASPLKKSKHLKHSKSRSEPTITNSIFAVLSAKPKTKKRRNRSASPSGGKKQKKDKERHRRHSSGGHHHDKSEKTDKGDKPSQKLLEYPRKEDEDTNHGQMIVYQPRADLFLSFVNKGPDSERGCSMNKALKRFHRERKSAGIGKDKQADEKELFRSLRLRKNDRGEIVLFCIDEDA